MPHVLVVEDETDVRELLILHLKREGYEITAFDGSENVLERCAHQNFDLIILDWMLPSVSGLDLCRMLRSNLKVKSPIMMLTARADTMDKVLGLEMGADDYLTKPFEVREFVARVRALLRRNQEPALSILELSGIKIDLGSKKVLVDQIETPLTAFEFKLLSTLMLKAGITLARSELVKAVQGGEVNVVERTIDTQILGLRKKLGNRADTVETVRGFGYRFKK